MKRLTVMLIVITLLILAGCGTETDEDTATVKNDSGDNVYGFAMRNTLWWTFPFFNTYGADFIRDGKCVLAEKEGIQALQFKVDLYRKYQIEAGAWQAGAIGPDTGFLNEKYAMIFDGPWDVKRFKDAGLNFGVSLIPEGPYGTSTNVGGTNMVLFNNSDKPYWAAKFLEFMVSPEIQSIWCNKLEQIPVNLKAYDMVDTTDKPYLKVFMEQMRHAKARPQILDYGELEEIINPQMEAALKEEKTVDQALNDASRRIEEKILSKEKDLQFPDGDAGDFSTDKKGQIKIWVTYNPTELEVFNQIVSMFEQKYAPVKVVVEQIPWGGHQEKILTSLATQTTPDIARIDAAFTYKLAYKNAIFNLSQFSMDYLTEELSPAAIGACKAAGKLWAVPDQVTGVALFYNKDMFAEANIMNPPKTWEEFVEIGKKLTGRR
ncbi:MAG: extracellular solute-binding protein [Candidatus Muiribacteriaceae bacterium]